MQKKRIIILGAGISGLAAAWYLGRTGLPLDIVVLEKSERPGGWLHTDHTAGFHFEKGPRTFQVGRCPHLMGLIAELGIQNEVIWTPSKQHHRYFWNEGELHRFPTNPLSFLFSPITKGFVRALLTEWRKPPKTGDETVWEFAVRRFNYDVARLFFDPMVVGIFGGDVRKISIRSCFPEMKRLEEQYGSVTKGMLARRKEKKGQSPFSPDVPHLPLSAIFSFQQGVEGLTQSLVSQIPAAIRYQCAAKEVHFEGGKVLVETDAEKIEGDYLFCALPAHEAARLFEKHAPEAAKEFGKVHSEGMTIVNFGYDATVLPVEGFGYLSTSASHEEILGVVFDSSVFPHLNRAAQETRLTVMLSDQGKSEEAAIDAALKGIRRQLGISRVPAAVSYQRAEKAIPQYGVGHLEKMEETLGLFRKKLPQCQLVGNYLSGVSVNGCVERAKRAVAEWRESFS